MNFSRTFDFEPATGGPVKKITVTLCEPIPDPDKAGWQCELKVDGFTQAWSMRYPGDDALDAFLMALWYAPEILRVRFEPGKLTWNGSEDLGFRSMEGQPPIAHRLSPPPVAPTTP